MLPMPETTNDLRMMRELLPEDRKQVYDSLIRKYSEDLAQDDQMLILATLLVLPRLKEDRLAAVLRKLNIS